MCTGQTLFAQLMDLLPWTTFARVVSGTDAGWGQVDRPHRGRIDGQKGRAPGRAALNLDDSALGLQGKRYVYRCNVGRRFPSSTV